MIKKAVWHLVGLAFMGALGYGTYWIWGNIPAWVKGTNVNDLRILIGLVSLFLVLSLGEAVWARVPGKPH